MSFPNQEEATVQPAVQPLQEDGVLIHGVQKLSLVVLHSLMVSLEERRPLEACPSHSYSLSKKKVESFQLGSGVESTNMKKGGIFDMEGLRGWSMEEGDVGVDTNSSNLAMYHGDSRN